MLKYLKYSSWGIAEYLAYPILMFIVTPFFLKQLGDAQYGQWMFLMAFTGIGGVAGLGMGSATIREISVLRGKNDLANAAKVVCVAYAVTLLSSLLLVLILFIVAYFFGNQLFGKMGSAEEIKTIFFFAALLITVEQVDTIYTGVIRGMERFDIAAQTEILSKLIIVLFSALVAWQSHKLQILLIVSATLTILRTSLKAYLAGSLLGTKLFLPRWDLPIAKRVLQFGKWTWLQYIGSALFATADRLIIGSSLGANALAQYSVCLQLAQQIHTIPSAAAGFIFPLISRKIAEQDQDIKRFSLSATVISSAMSLAIAAPIIYFSKEILTLWVGATMAAQAAYILVGLSISFVILAVNIVPHFVLLGCNNARFIAISNLIAGVASILASLMLIPTIGVTGAIYARTVYGFITLSNLFGMNAEFTKRHHPINDPL